ncbi:MAG TPA: DUF47 family protein, partial [Solirubrobacteraceae bacterium]|nr:DUF47 family protein [Solirubrobacteraceae bacterium]
NDRVKYLLALLQSARAAADGGRVSDLHEERLAGGVEDPALDRVVGASALASPGVYRIPRADKVIADALADVEAMLAPLLTAGVEGAQELGRRLAALRPSLELDGELVSAQTLVALTSAERERDSLHLLVVDAHRELNALFASLATETVDGALVHNLEPDDRALVRAFMRGVNETERLRFGHPGLGTIATHSGPALVLQNDLGETEAHVVVVRVQQRTVTITYTDVHLERLIFFQRLLADRAVQWQDTRSRADRAVEGGLFHLAVGARECEDTAELERFLAELGSQLVFMIDWNRARKRLRGLVGKRAAVELLSWAAEHRHGHRAFLIAGGDRLVRDALQFAGRPGIDAGSSLSDVLGAPAAVAYLRSVLRICSEGMLAERPLPLIQDEVRAELVGYVHTAREELLELICRHGELVVEIAEATRDQLEQTLSANGSPQPALAAGRARAWEHEADEVVTRVRAYMGRPEAPHALLEVLEAADDIADSLEDAAFYLTLARLPTPAGEIPERLRSMCALLLASARAHLRAVTFAADVQRGAPREQMEAFLEAVHEVVSLEREADDAQRAVHAALVACAPPASVMFVLAEVTRAFEEAADALMHTALLLRDQVLGGAVRAQASLRRGELTPAPRAEGLAADRDVYVLGDTSRALPGPDEIGAKAHGLARMVRAGLRVPEAAVLTTAVARRAHSDGGMPPIAALSARAVGALEFTTGLRLGDRRRPLVVSVRSGAPVSMPGMLETVLDVGLSERTIAGFAASTGNPRLAWDCYRRLVESFAAAVHGCPPEAFERALEERLAAAGLERPVELEASVLRELTGEHLQRFQELAGEPFPEDPRSQLEQAVGAVLRSWQAPKAREYRRVMGVPDELGTAVIVQRMVFGNAGGRSGAGVGFTRDPALGAPGLYVDFLADAQGEDIVAGRQPLRAAAGSAAIDTGLQAELEHACRLLERELGDAQEFEFTVQDGELFLLQTRTAKRTPWAALQIAVDQVREGLISPEVALEHLAGVELDDLRRRRVRREDESSALARAVPASPGVASGPLALDAAAARRFAEQGRPPVIIRRETSTDDIAAMVRSAGILTAVGGRTSHAAVVARELGRPCLVGCTELAIDEHARTATIGSRMLAEGDEITLDGESGLVYAGVVAAVEERPTDALAAVRAWQTAEGAEPAAVSQQV